MLTLALLFGTVIVLHRIARAAEDRGLIYYRHHRPSRSALGNAFLEVQTLVDPGKRLVLEARRHEPQDDGAQEDPPARGVVRRDVLDDAPAATGGLVLHPSELAARIVAADVDRCRAGGHRLAAPHASRR